jgi:hypothetical protein
MVKLLKVNLLEKFTPPFLFVFFYKIIVNSNNKYDVVVGIATSKHYCQVFFQNIGPRS